MRNCAVLFVSITLGVLLSVSPAFAPVEVPEPSSLVLTIVGMGAASLYAFLKRKR